MDHCRQTCPTEFGLLRGDPCQWPCALNCRCQRSRAALHVSFHSHASVAPSPTVPPRAPPPPPFSIRPEHRRGGVTSCIQPRAAAPFRRGGRGFSQPPAPLL